MTRAEMASDRRKPCVDIALVFDSPDENWPSMDLVGEMLLEQWRSAPTDVTASTISLRIPRLARRVLGDRKFALDTDRALVRYLAYPVRGGLARRSQRFFHV